MDSNKKLDTETQQADIIVVGGGAAGLCAAIAASEKGVDVILLERAAKPGGNSAMAGAFFACNSPLHKRLNIQISADELFKRHMDFCHYAVNPRIVRTFIDKSGDTIEWLEKKGISFELLSMKKVRFGYEIPPIAHIPKGFGRGFIEDLTRIFEESGGRLLCGTRARELLMDKQEVTGVLATRKDEEVRVYSKSVILASGGYAGNKELLKKYAPQYSENIQISGYPNMGDGLLMALNVGAATEGLGMLHIESKGFYPTGPEALWNMVVNPSTISVNKKGERFMDEGIGSVFEAANPVLLQPDKMSYTLFDKNIMHKLEQLRIERGGIISGGRLPKGEKVLDTENVLKLSEEKGLAKISDSWDEIADWIGVAPETLKNTIDEYNSFCDKGRDDIFLKDPDLLISLRTPPYYAIKCSMRIHCTCGGIKINHHMEVLDKEHKPIPGLYATGIEAGGWVTETYDQVYLGGSGLGFPVNSGRIAGESAVEYVSKKK